MTKIDDDAIRVSISKLIQDIKTRADVAAQTAMQNVSMSALHEAYNAGYTAGYNDAKAEGKTS